MTIFDKTIQDPGKIYVPTSGDQSTGIALGGIGKLVEGGLDVRDESIKEDITARLSEISKQEESYVDSKAKLEQSLQDQFETGITAADKKTVDDLDKKLRLLDQNEEDEKLSPLQAKATRSKLLREYVTKYPWLSPEINSLGSAFKSPYSGTGAPKSAIDKIREDPKLVGIPLSRIIESQQQDFRIHMEQQAGIQDAPTLRSNIINEAQSSSNKLYIDLASRWQENKEGFDSVMEAAKINLHEGQAIARLHSRAAQLSAQGSIISKEDIAKMEAGIKSQYAYARAFAEAKDKEAVKKRADNIAKYTSLEEMRNLAPQFAKLVDTVGSEVAWKYLETISIYSEKFNGDIGRMRAAAEASGNPLLQAWAKQGNVDMAATAFSWMFADSPSPDPRTPPPDPADPVSSMTGAAAAMAAKDPELAATPEGVKARETLVYGENWRLLHPEISLDDREKVKLQSRLDFEAPSIIDAVREEAPVFQRHPTQEFFGVPQPERTGQDTVEFDPDKKEFVFSSKKDVPQTSGPLSSGFLPKIQKRMEGKAAPRNAIDKLNVMYNLYLKNNLFKSEEERRQWVEQMTNEINKAPEQPATDTTTRGEEARSAAERATGMTVNQQGAFDLIAKYEKFKSAAYTATDEERKRGIYTVGYGRTEGVTADSKMTREEAEADLQEQIATTTTRLQEEVGPTWNTLTEGQKAAVVSLAYNVDKDVQGQLRRSKALEALRNGDFYGFMEEAFDEKKGFVRQNGKVLRGLVRRRQEERDMFEEGIQYAKAQGNDQASTQPQKLEDGVYRIDDKIVQVVDGKLTEIG